MSSPPFGYHKQSNQYLDIDDVDSGLICDCICPACNMILIARKGDVNEHHFAHYEDAEVECKYSYWVSVRSMAEQILLKSKYLNIDSNSFKNLYFNKSIPFSKTSQLVKVYSASTCKASGTDIKLITSIGLIDVYFLTGENESEGRIREHHNNRARFFTDKLVLEIDLKLKMKESTERLIKKKSNLHEILISDIYSKKWVKPLYGMKVKVVKINKNNIINSKNIIESRIVEKPTRDIFIEEDVEPKRTSVSYDSVSNLSIKELKTFLGLKKIVFSQQDQRTLSELINYTNYQLRYDRTIEIKEDFNIIHEGRFLWFINYKREFYFLARIGAYLYVYQVDEKSIYYIAKASTLNDVEVVIDYYLYEKLTVF